jgi:hypothetical protein
MYPLAHHGIVITSSTMVIDDSSMVITGSTGL